MSRKKIAEQEPGVPMAGAAGAAVVKAPAKNASGNKARAPRASANAVTHKHKKTVVAVQAEPASPSVHFSSAKPTSDDVAKLAYSYWEARGYQHGSQDEDWLRAERELGLR
jgi:hypothetical protein